MYPDGALTSRANYIRPPPASSVSLGPTLRCLFVLGVRSRAPTAGEVVAKFEIVNSDATRL